MKTIAIQDANILIDLVDVNIFSHCLALPYNFTTTQLIFESELNERQVSAIQTHIDSGNFTIIKTSEEELDEIQAMSQECDIECLRSSDTFSIQILLFSPCEISKH